MAKVVRNKGRSKRVAKAPAEAPVSDEIRAAAARIGIPPSAYLEQEAAKRFAETPLTFTLREVCDAVGYEVSPESFAADALERIAQQIETAADNHQDDHEEWHRMVSIAERANFAARVVRKLNDAKVAS